MARVKLRCIMGLPELKSNYQEKGILINKNVATLDEFCYLK